MNPSLVKTLEIFVIALIVVLLAGATVRFIVRMSDRKKRRQKNVVSRGLGELISIEDTVTVIQQLEDFVIRRERSSRLQKVIEEKKQKFLNVPSISFHFADKDRIRDFYNDYFKEPTIESLVAEIAGETSGEVKGSIPQVLESRIGGKDLKKWISTIKLPDITLSGMFRRYQRETIKRNEVTLGLEEVDIELTEVQEFEDLIQKLEDRFGLKIASEVLEERRTYLKEKAAEKTLIRLEQATGFVLIEGRFRIEEMDKDFYRCVFFHPVNQYLSQQVGPVTISVLIPKDSLEPSVAGNYARSIGSLVPLRIYGEVWKPIDRATESWDLQIIPLALY